MKKILALMILTLFAFATQAQKVKTIPVEKSPAVTRVPE
jgi:hypothetical protein